MKLFYIQLFREQGVLLNSNLPFSFIVGWIESNQSYSTFHYIMTIYRLLSANYGKKVQSSNRIFLHIHLSSKHFNNHVQYLEILNFKADDRPWSMYILYKVGAIEIWTNLRDIKAHLNTKRWLFLVIYIFIKSSKNICRKLKALLFMIGMIEILKIMTKWKEFPGQKKIHDDNHLIHDDFWCDITQ